MPKALDSQRLTVTNSPTQRIDLNSGKQLLPEFDISGMIDNLISLIEDATGIDLSALEPIIDGLTSGLDLITTALSALTSGDPTQLLAWFTNLGNLDLLNVFPNVLSAFDGIDLTDPGAILSAIISAVAEAVADIPVVGELAALIENLVNGGQPINVQNLFGQLTQGLFGIVPASSISSNNPNLLNNGGFDGSISMDGSGVWTYDATTGHTSNGSASTTANSTLKALLSNAVDVTVGQKLSPTVWVKTSSYAGTGTPIRLAVKTYLAGAAVSTTNISSIAGPGGTWTQMTGTYTVPSGVDSVRLRLVVDTTATGGTIWFDDGSLTKPGNGPFDGILQLFGLTSLEDLFDGLNIDDIWSAIITAIMNPLGLLEDAIGRGDLSDTISSIFGALTGGGTVTNPLDDLAAALQQIPFLNILGIGGPADIGASIQSTWDQWISGLVGVLGTGAGLSDIFNVGQQVSSQAALGGFSWDILGIRGNNPLTSGFLPTSKSNISLDQLVLTPGTVGITQSTALTAYTVIAESIDIGAISWQGQGVTNVTDAYVNLFKMDPVTGNNGGALHASTNQIGLLSGTMQQNIYSLPSPVHYEPGDILGVEIAIRGAGTHSVIGAASTLVDQAVYPRRWSSVRNSGTSAPPSSSWTPTYSNNVPFIEHAVTASIVAIPRSPETTLFNTAGSRTLPVPSWASTVQVISVGGGGAGRQGGTYGVQGEGGDGGSWDTATWTRGVHFSGSPSLAIVVPAQVPGGGNTGTSGGIGANGGNVTVTLPATSGFSAATRTALGGEGGDALVTVGDPNMFGQSPGNQVYDGVTYVGGGQQQANGAAGAAPGGGGAGGNWVSFQWGGWGIMGAAWIRFKQ